MSSETEGLHVLDEDKAWAVRVAPNYDWETHNRVFYYGDSSDDDIRAMERAGMLYVREGDVAWDGGLCWGADMRRCDALAFYRDWTLDALNDLQARYLLDPYGYYNSGVLEQLRVMGLMKRGPGKPVRTNFGREIVRLMKARNRAVVSASL